LWHALVLGSFFLPIWRSSDDVLPPAATVLFEEPGSSGAAGAASGGGGEDASVTAQESRPTSTEEAKVQTPAPPARDASAVETAVEAPPEAPPQERTERTVAPTPLRPDGAQVATAMPEPAPPTPRAKPTPPRRAAPAPAPVRRAEVKPKPSQATPGPMSGSGMAAKGPARTGVGATAGAGRGTDGTDQGALGEGAEGPGDEYFERLRRHLKRYQRWPDDLGDRDRGTALVTFTIGRDGTIRAAQIERSSGYAALDQATLDMLRHGSPVPPLPSTFRGDQITVTMPAEWKRGFFLRKLF
jgi:protein TonB